MIRNVRVQTIPIPNQAISAELGGGTCTLRNMISLLHQNDESYRKPTAEVLKLFLDFAGVSTHLWNTPLNLYQQAMIRDSFHCWRTGDCPGACSWWVCCHLLGVKAPNKSTRFGVQICLCSRTFLELQIFWSNSASLDEQGSLILLMVQKSG